MHISLWSLQNCHCLGLATTSPDMPVNNDIERLSTPAVRSLWALGVISRTAHQTLGDRHYDSIKRNLKLRKVEKNVPEVTDQAREKAEFWLWGSIQSAGSTVIPGALPSPVSTSVLQCRVSATCHTDKGSLARWIHRKRAPITSKVYKSFMIWKLLGWGPEDCTDNSTWSPQNEMIRQRRSPIWTGETHTLELPNEWNKQTSQTEPEAWKQEQTDNHQRGWGKGRKGRV